MQKVIYFCWLSQVPTEVNNRVQSLLLNYHFALFRSADFTLVYYQMGELEYIRFTFILFFPLSWQRNIVWISCNWLFYSLWLEEEFEIYFDLVRVFTSFIHILPLTLDFLVNMVFETIMPGMFIWKLGPSSSFWSMNFQTLIKWEWVYRIPYTENRVSRFFFFFFFFFIEESWIQCC